jgi:hypothetical protein
MTKSRNVYGNYLLTLPGKVYGRITVTAVAGQDSGGNTIVRGTCSCGSPWEGAFSRLKGGHTKSCGCLNREINTKHGASYTKEYGIWQGMRKRCNNPKHVAYAYYGGRGIKVCSRWDDFSTFLSDMGPRPSPAYSIDRIDNNLGYSPENCRWATATEQNNNTSRAALITFNGETRSKAEWARHLGMKVSILGYRLKSGWSVEDALHIPVGSITNCRNGGYKVRNCNADV